MPFYDFQCTNNHRFELKQSFHSATVTTCPRCANPAKRLISLVPIHFKGSGFYVTDYARKEPASTSEPGKTSTEAKTDTKPAEAGKPAEAAKSAPVAEAK